MAGKQVTKCSGASSPVIQATQSPRLLCPPPEQTPFLCLALDVRLPVITHQPRPWTREVVLYSSQHKEGPTAYAGFLSTSLQADVSVYSQVTDKVTRRTVGEPAPQRETQNTRTSHRQETQPPCPQRPCRLGLHLESDSPCLGRMTWQASNNEHCMTDSIVLPSKQPTQKATH